MYWSEFISVYLKYFFILTPFFILAVFLAITEHETETVRRKLAIRVTGGVIAISLILFWFGQTIFSVLGITVDAFRIGAGLVLMLNGIDMVRSELPKNRQISESGDPSVVPLAIPTTVGPGTIGTLLVMGASCAERAVQAGFSRWFFLLIELCAVILSGAGVSIMLYFSETLNRIFKDKGVRILSKLTGMYIVALAAQIIFDGVRGFLNIQ